MDSYFFPTNSLFINFLMLSTPLNNNNFKCISINYEGHLHFYVTEGKHQLGIKYKKYMDFFRSKFHLGLSLRILCCDTKNPLLN